MSESLELECIYSRVSRLLGCNGFLGFVLGDLRSVFKLLLTCRSERPGGRLWEVVAVVDRYLDLKPYNLYCIVGCYVLCTLRGQRALFKELRRRIPIDKTGIGKGERTWLIHKVNEYKQFSEDYLQDPDKIVLECPSVDLGYVIGWKNYILAHPEIKDITSRLRGIPIKIKDVGV